MEEQNAHITKEKLEQGAESALQKARLMLEYESMLIQRQESISLFERRIRAIVRFAWLSIILTLSLALVEVLLK